MSGFQVKKVAVLGAGVMGAQFAAQQGTDLSQRFFDPAAQLWARAGTLQ